MTHLNSLRAVVADWPQPYQELLAERFAIMYVEHQEQHGEQRAGDDYEKIAVASFESVRDAAIHRGEPLPVF